MTVERTKREMRARGVRAGAHVRAGILLVLAALLLLCMHVGVWWVSGAAPASAPRGERPRGARDKVARWLERVATGAARMPVHGLPGSQDAAHEPAVLKRLRALEARVDAEDEALSDADVIWPRVFVIGAPKAASTTLSSLLSLHPQMCSAKPQGKATQAKEVGILFAHRLKVYLKHVYGRAGTGGIDPRCGRGDGSDGSEWAGKTKRLLYMDNHPLYLHASGNFSQRMRLRVPERLHPEMRFIVLVREPVTRALSQLIHQRRPTCRWWCDEANRGRLSQEDMVAELLSPSSDAVSRSRYDVVKKNINNIINNAKK